MKIKKTQRGFEVVEFDDERGEACSLQQSSAWLNDDDIPGASAVWLGKKDSRMHLSKRQVGGLIRHLINWLVNDTFAGE